MPPTVKSTLPAAALALALGAAFTALPAMAQPADKEKCYGVALKGKNDCKAGAVQGRPPGQCLVAGAQGQLREDQVHDLAHRHGPVGRVHGQEGLSPP